MATWQPSCVRSISGGGGEVGRRLMRIAGSPLGQPSLSPASGIFIVIFFCHLENNGTRLMRRQWRGKGVRLGRTGGHGKEWKDRYWDREMIDFFL